MMKAQKIITHPGIFHADEVLAIVTYIRYFGQVSQIERRKPEKGELDDKNILVVDTGGEYEPSKNNFDHHQDSSLPSSNLLILEEIEKMFENDKNFHRVSYYLKKFLYNNVSNVDLGLVKRENNDPTTFSNIISNFNNLPDPEEGFQKALEIAQEILKSYIHTSYIAASARKIWDNLEEHEYNGKKIKVSYDETFIPGWKEMAREENVHFLIMPNKQQPEYVSMVSFDTDVIKIPSDAEGQTFCHNSGFLAVYQSVEKSLAHAKEILSG